MLPALRIVTKTPLSELWDDQGRLPLQRGRGIGRLRVAELLRMGRARFVVAICGEPLNWVLPKACFKFWKDHAEPHLIEPDVAERGFQLEDLPDKYGYTATEWIGSEQTVVLLEKHH